MRWYLYSSGMAERKFRQFKAAVLFCIQGIAAGVTIGWTSDITDKLKEGESYGVEMDDDQVAWLGSLMTLGAMVMCLPVGWLCDAWNRHWTMGGVQFILGVGWFMILYLHQETLAYVSRILTGGGVGPFYVIAPLYTSEIAETSIRGTLGTFFQLFSTIGILWTNIFGYVLNLWQFNISCVIVLGVPLFCFGLYRESPIYYLRKHQMDDVEKSYIKLRGSDYDFGEELRNEQQNIAREKGFCETMRTKAAKKATLICFMLMFYQQLSGVSAVIFYTKAVFDEVDTYIPSHWCVICMGIIQVVGTTFAACAIEKLGRKILLMASCGIMGLSCFLLGIYFSIKKHVAIDKEVLKSIGVLPVFWFMLYILGFSIGLGPIPWLAPSELFPGKVKLICSSAAATFNWLLAFLVTRLFFTIIKAAGTESPFYIFAIICITGVFFVQVIMPETKGKSFQEITAELET